ncbi:site-specific integrase [Paraglaciecola sp. 2405UD69-4]|uniref:site-specific integrase n=1 Tax=Paraglaciecola sp. 2405UD69-4 TaxID=3391836 RepID=UPI0039C9CFC8
MVSNAVTNLVDLPTPSIDYEIVTTKLKPFTYKNPIVVIDDNGEPQVSFSRNNHVHIKQITFLNLVGRDGKGNVVSYHPLEQVNRFLMAHHINDGREESDQYAKGLTHYFSFLIRLQKKWDEEFDEFLFDELVDLPRPEWNFMATRKDQRLTYQYRAALKYSVLKEPDPRISLARTTATAYMNAVVKFYSFHLRDGLQFNNPPFEHEIIKLHFEAGATSMKAYMTKDVHTSDLRLNFPRSKRNNGEAGEPGRRDLRPLTNQQWSEVEMILLRTKRVVKNVKGRLQFVNLAEEYCIFFLVSRFTGLRKEEVASLHSGQIVKPPSNKPMLRIGVGDEYGSLTKSKDGTNKSRRTIIPSATMRLLYQYIRSTRYLKRLAKFRDLCKAKRNAGEAAFFDSVDGVDENKNYVFISNSGMPFFLKLNELNNRWSEIRNTVKLALGQEMQGSCHNLRPTFAVALFRILLTKMTADKSLAAVADVLGHDDFDTTLKYLKIAQDEPTGDEIYEDVLDYLGVFDDFGDEVDSVTHYEVKNNG